MSIPTNEATPDAGAPEGYPMQPVQPAAPQKNGFAIASLVFGIIGGILFGLGFGIAGLVRAKKVGKGKAMSWIGIALSILWIAPIAYVVPHLLKASDTGCMSAKDTLTAYGESKMTADQNDPAAVKADLQALVSGLTSAAAKAGDSAARDAIQKVAGDFKELASDLDSGTAPSADLQSRLDADANKVDSACGTIGS